MMRRDFREARGAAAVEFALWLGILVVPFLNVVDVGFYCYQTMQVREAAQVAAQSAETLCGSATQKAFPASLNCTGLSTLLTSAAQTTSLGTRVTVVTASTAAVHTTEGYYCANATGQLTAVSATGKTNPWPMSATSSRIPDVTTLDCKGVNANNDSNPGDYIAVTVTYTYTPLFGAVSAASMLGGAVTETSWIRVG